MMNRLRAGIWLGVALGVSAAVPVTLAFTEGTPDRQQVELRTPDADIDTVEHEITTVTVPPTTATPATEPPPETTVAPSPPPPASPAPADMDSPCVENDPRDWCNWGPGQPQPRYPAQPTIPIPPVGG